MNLDYGAEYAQLYRWHWWWRARGQIVLDILRRLQLPTGADILDFGRGDGLLFPVLEQFGYPRGIEIDQSLLTADNPYRDQIESHPLGYQLYDDWQFDLITALDVIEHIEGDRNAVKNLVRLLKVGGRLVISVPAFMLLWDHHDEINHHHPKDYGKLVPAHQFASHMRRCYLRNIHGR